MNSLENNTKHTHGEFIFEDIAYKAVVYSKSLDRYFVSDALRVDSGLACLFGFENNGISEFDDLILCSEKFVSEIQEAWWEQDWAHIGNIEYTKSNDKNDVEIYNGDIVVINDTDFEDDEDPTPWQIKKMHGTFVLFYSDSDYYYLDQNIDSFMHSFPSSWELEVIGNIYENPELRK